MTNIKKWIRTSIYYLLDQLLKISNILSRFSRDFRFYQLNSNPKISIADNVHLPQSVKFQFDPDGFHAAGKVIILSGARLGEGVILAPWDGTIEIDENVYIGPYSVLYGAGGLKIGRNTLIAAHVCIFSSNHAFDDHETPIRNQPMTMKGIEIGEDVWIGSGAKILDGVTIGRGSVVGAGSVVTKSLEDYSVAYGVPAKTIKKRIDNQLLSKSNY